MASKVPSIGGGAAKMFAALIKSLNTGQDVMAALSMAESKAGVSVPTKLGPGQLSKPKSPTALGGGVSDLEKLVLQAMVVGQLDKLVKTSIDLSDFKRKLSALQTSKSKLNKLLEEADKSVDVADLKAAAKQQALRLKQEQAKIDKTVGQMSNSLKKYETLSANVMLFMVLSTIFVKAAEEQSFGIEKAVALVVQSGLTSSNVKSDGPANLDSAIKQAIMFVKQSSDAKAEHAAMKHI